MKMIKNKAVDSDAINIESVKENMNKTDTAITENISSLDIK